MSFRLIKVSSNGVRLGRLNGKNTPRFFMINDFGGGGTNVSRFFVYSSLFAAGKSEILLNYYYLNTKFTKTPAFNTDLLKDILSFDDIRIFLEHVRRNLIEVKRNCMKGTKYQPMKWNPIVLVDSGSGNIFRDILPRLSESNFEKVFLSEVRYYINFCETLKISIAIGLDIAGKYTWKKGETANREYLGKLKMFSKPEWNLLVNKSLLQHMPHKPIVAYYAPIHGNLPSDYVNYLNQILSLEKKLDRKYAGLAIGGIGKTPRPIVYKIVELVRNRLSELSDDRPIHVLGVGAVQNIIPLSINGADTFDCNSPWRRANEDKLVIPLLNSHFEITAKDKTYWKYIPIESISNLECDCEVCRRHSLSELRELKNGTTEEKYYFRISAYRHNIHQQEILCELVRTNIDLENLIRKFPKSSYRDKMLHFLTQCSQRTLV